MYSTKNSKLGQSQSQNFFPNLDHEMALLTKQNPSFDMQARLANVEDPQVARQRRAEEARRKYEQLLAQVQFYPDPTKLKEEEKRYE